MVEPAKSSAISSEWLNGILDRVKSGAIWQEGENFCTRCGGRDLVRVGADGVVVDRQFTCRCESIRRDANGKSIIFADFGRLTFENFEVDLQPVAYRAVLDAMVRMVSEQRNLVVRGPFGVGKSHLVCAVANDFMARRGCYVVAMSMEELAHRMKAGEWDRLLAKVLECGLFIADDFGRHSAVSSWLIDQYFTIFDSRLRSRRPFAITTNYSNAEFIKKFGAVDLDMAQAIMERVVERSCVVEMAGDSYRLRKNFIVSR